MLFLSCLLVWVVLTWMYFPVNTCCNCKIWFFNCKRVFVWTVNFFKTENFTTKLFVWECHCNLSLLFKLQKISITVVVSTTKCVYINCNMIVMWFFLTAVFLYQLQNVRSFFLNCKFTNALLASLPMIAMTISPLCWVANGWYTYLYNVSISYSLALLSGLFVDIVVILSVSSRLTKYYCSQFIDD